MTVEPTHLHTLLTLNDVESSWTHIFTRSFVLSAGRERLPCVVSYISLRPGYEPVIPNERTPLLNHLGITYMGPKLKHVPFPKELQVLTRNGGKELNYIGFSSFGINDPENQFTVSNLHKESALLAIRTWWLHPAHESMPMNFRLTATAFT